MVRHICPVVNKLSFLNKKWVLLIIRELSIKSPLRFTELEKNIDGINSRILSLRLKELKKKGIVTKAYFKELPPRVEYSLTSKGKALMNCFKYLNEWVVKWKQ